MNACSGKFDPGGVPTDQSFVNFKKANHYTVDSLTFMPVENYKLNGFTGRQHDNMCTLNRNEDKKQYNINFRSLNVCPRMQSSKSSTKPSGD